MLLQARCAAIAAILIVVNVLQPRQSGAARSEAPLGLVVLLARFGLRTTVWPMPAASVLHGWARRAASQHPRPPGDLAGLLWF